MKYPKDPWLWAQVFLILVICVVLMQPVVSKENEYEGSDYEFISDCFGKYMQLFRENSDDLKEIPDQDVKDKMTKAVQECANQLERFKGSTVDTAREYHM